MISDHIKKQLCNVCEKYLNLEKFYYDKSKNKYWIRCNNCISIQRRFRLGQEVRASAKDDLETVIQRIKSKCKKNGKCNEWQGGKSREGGYGHIRFKGKLSKTHRLMYCYANDVELEDIEGLLVCHSCDNPSCCNEKHLVLGTHLDNMEDKVFKNRHFKKLTVSDVKAIRSRIEKNHKHKIIAHDFGVSVRLINSMSKGERHSKTGVIESPIKCEAVQ